MHNPDVRTSGHAPVLLPEVVDALRPREGGIYVDCTFGGGGYSRALLDQAVGAVIGIDRDPDAVARGRNLEAADGRFRMLQGRFGDLGNLLASIDVPVVDGIVADLGLSSFQLADAARGFSFQGDGPLDMRMEGREGGISAADLLNALDEDALARILRDYGDEPHAKRIARAIVAQRRRAPLTRTYELRSLVVRVKGRQLRDIDPSTQTFQALRMAVNEEVSELESLLQAAVDLLRPDGRLVVVSFHSGEDRIVKQFIDRESGRASARSRHLPPVDQPVSRLAWVKRAVVRPTSTEVAHNPRARSARMRVAIRLPAGEHRQEDDVDKPPMFMEAA